MTYSIRVFLCSTATLQFFLCSNDPHVTAEAQVGNIQPELISLLAPWCRHTLIKKLCQLRESEPELAQLLMDQVRPDWVWHPFLPWGGTKLLSC